MKFGWRKESRHFSAAVFLGSSDFCDEFSLRARILRVEDEQKSDNPGIGWQPLIRNRRAGEADGSFWDLQNATS